MDAFQQQERRHAKRRRVEMDAPDGFMDSPNQPARAVHKANVPSFASAFESEPVAGSTLTSRGVSVRRQAAPRVWEGGEHVGMKEKEKENTEGKQTKERRVVSVRDVLRDITLDPPSRASKVQLRPPSLAVASSSKVALKRIAAPAFPVSKPPSGKPLQAIQPPVNVALVGRSRVEGKDMRRISTTGLVDLSLVNAGDELAGILHDGECADDTAGGGATRRGLELSPEKRGKGNTLKLARGGLAARAAAQFERTRTGVILWRRQMEMDSLRGPVPGAEIAVDVLKVVHAARAGTIALCRVRRPGGEVHPRFSADNLYRVVFAGAEAQREVEEGDLVRVFKPWSEMPLVRELAGVRRRLPADLPSLSAPLVTPDPLDAPLDNVVIFCSRFFIS